MHSATVHQAKQMYQYKSIKETWYKTDAAIWYNNRLSEDEPSGSKHVEDIKINIKILI
jgi:hypothetical protein